VAEGHACGSYGKADRKPRESATKPTARHAADRAERWVDIYELHISTVRSLSRVH